MLIRSPLLIFSAFSLAGALAACSPPKNYTPVADVPKIKTLKELMDAQATAADPEFGKREQASFTDEEFTAFGDTGGKIDATSKHLKSFSKGPEWDAFADRLNGTAGSLSKAASAKDAAGARAALSDMKKTCKECHSKFR